MTMDEFAEVVELYSKLTPVKQTIARAKIYELAREAEERRAAKQQAEEERQ